jgi:hypothetical protein
LRIEAFFQSTVDAEEGLSTPGHRVLIETNVATLEAIRTRGRADEKGPWRERELHRA